MRFVDSLSPRSRITKSVHDSIRGCKRSTNGTYPTVFRRITWLRVMIVFLRVVYDDIQSFTVANNLSNISFRTVNDVGLRKCTVVAYDDDEQPFPCARR